MFKFNSTLPAAAAAIAAATVIAACGSSSLSSSNSSNSSSSGDPPTQAQIQQTQQEAVRFSDCMRSHGVPTFPDPTTSPHGFKQALDPSVAHSPAFQSAYTACGHLLPGGGKPNPSPSASQAQVAAALAFARCIRSHGFPRFPDPSSSGDLSHQMLANAGIDIHQPAVLGAADSCVSVTHGFITKAAVARFVAGQ